jgi:drug/metabolite transporter (DMT)-like permease
MKNLSISGLLAGVMLVLTISFVPISYKVITSPPEKWLIPHPYADPVSCLMLMFTAASLTALTIAAVTRQSPPLRANRKTAFSLGLAGCIAAFYFIVVIILDPATADWLETAFFSVFVIILGLTLEKEHPPALKWVGVVIALLGVTVFFSHQIKMILGGSSLRLWEVMLFAVMGALGSAFSVILMGRLVHRYNVGRFYAMAIRYGTPSILLVMVVSFYTMAIRYGTPAILLLAVPFMGKFLLTTLGFIGSIFVGSVLINATLYFALVTLKKLGPISLGVFLILVPVMTTFWVWLIYRPPHRQDVYYLGATMILLGAVVCEFGWRWFKVVGRRSIG